MPWPESTAYAISASAFIDNVQLLKRKLKTTLKPSIFEFKFFLYHLSAQPSSGLSFFLSLSFHIYMKIWLPQGP